MNNEKRDEFLSWRSHLDPMEGVPGQGLDDNEATWERLMDRIREKPRRRLPVYSIAAACLLLALIPAARLFRDSSSRETVHPHVVQRATPLASHPDERSHEHAVGPGKTGGTDKRQDAAHRQKTHTGSRMGMAGQMGIVPVAGQTIHPPEAPPAPLLSLLPPARQTPASRKWKVVDLNELNSGWQPSSGMASNRRPGSIRIRLGSQEAGPTDEGAPPVRDLGLRIKLSTSN